LENIVWIFYFAYVHFQTASNLKDGARAILDLRNYCDYVMCGFGILIKQICITNFGQFCFTEVVLNEDQESNTSTTDQQEKELILKVVEPWVWNEVEIMDKWEYLLRRRGPSYYGSFKPLLEGNDLLMLG
jgi:hypothetical protein